MTPEPAAALDRKLDRLEGLLRAMGSVVVGVSGGVDSGTLLAVSARVLPPGRALAVTVSSVAEPPGEVDRAAELARSLGVEHVVVEVDWLGIDGIGDNPPDRCYLCKRTMFSRFAEIARQRGFSALLEGGNTDDLGDYRPGARALEELGVRRPMVEAGMSKADVREVARRLGLPIAGRPALACLGSRFPYGARLTEEAFDAVGRAESFLGTLGPGQLRVRVHGDVARIEVEPHMLGRLLERRAEIVERLGSIGFRFVTVDLGGYRAGSQNETLPPDAGRVAAPGGDR